MKHFEIVCLEKYYITYSVFAESLEEAENDVIAGVLQPKNTECLENEIVSIEEL